MARRIRWQLVLALVGTCAILGLVGAAALQNAARALPLTGQTYVEGVVGVPAQLNPLLQTAAVASERNLAALLFDGLTRPAADGAPAPALAERWTASPDLQTYTFTLRAELRWHDGVPLTAADAAWTIAQVQSAAFPGDPALAAAWQGIIVAQPDERTVIFTLPAPDASFATTAGLPILPVHILRDVPLAQWPQAPFSRAPVGSGPFRLEHLTASEAILRPFEGAARGRPLLDALILRFFPSASAAAQALRRRDVQGVAFDGSVTLPPTAGLEQRHAPLAEYALLSLNLSSGPLADSGVRAALAQGLDRAALLALLPPGSAQLLDTPILSGTWAFDPAATLPRFDLAAAGRALDALGWPVGADGVRQQGDEPLALPLIAADAAPEQALAAAIAAQWQRLGVAVSVETMPITEVAAHLADRSFTVALHRWSNVGLDPDAYALWHSSQAEQGANYAGLADAEIDTLLERGQQTADPAARRRIYSDFQRRWAALVPSIPLFQPLLTVVTDRRVAQPGLDGATLSSPAARFDAVAGWSLRDQ